MTEEEVRRQFAIPSDAVLVKTVQTKKYTSFLFHHKVGEGFVDGDRIVVKVDSAGHGKILAWNWEEGLLPAPGVPLLSRLMLKGEKSVLIDSANPFYTWIEKPEPRHPCLVSRNKKQTVISGQTVKKGQLIIKDAVTKKVIGFGSPPPSKAMAANAPTGSSSEWHSWRQSAAAFFRDLGLATSEFFTGDGIHTKTDIKNCVIDVETRAVYGIAHGSYANALGFWSASDIEAWLVNRDKMAFAFLAHCDGLCQTGSGTLSNAFRKASMEDTVTVGYCEMGAAKCLDAWQVSLAWQNRMFEYIKQGMTCFDAFEEAIADFPECDECIRLVGDPNLILKGGDGMATLSEVTVRLVKKVYNVRLTVLDDATSQPVAGAACSLDAVSGTTAENGQYTWTNVSPGGHVLLVSAVGYEPQSQALTLIA